MTNSDRCRGFTLLEMLVVLLIAGMALALSTVALGQYQRAHDRATANERAGREYRLSEAWFRESVQGLYPATSDAAEASSATARLGAANAPPKFVGTAEGFTGVTLQPVLAGQGVATLQSWNILRGADGVDRLELEEQDVRLVMSLPPAAGMRLHYLDAEGKLHERWPPATGLSKQLPAMVVLELGDGGVGDGALVIAASVLGPRDPLDPNETAYEYGNE